MNERTREVEFALERSMSHEIARLRERVRELKHVLARIHANAAESPDWIRHQVKEVMFRKGDEPEAQP